MLAFTTVGPILHLTQAYAQWSREQNRKILAHLGEANGAATEALANVRTVKAMATEEAEAARCRTASKAPSWRSPFWLIPFVAAASPRPGAADCHTPPRSCRVSLAVSRARRTTAKIRLPWIFAIRLPWIFAARASPRENKRRHAGTGRTSSPRATAASSTRR